jgi:hypothetical protein
LACGGHLEFCEAFCADHKFDQFGYHKMGPPWMNAEIAFCECGMWVRDDMKRVRWIRFSSLPFVIGDGKPLTAPAGRSPAVG